MKLGKDLKVIKLQAKDKVQRLLTLSTKTAPLSETIEDTLLDLASYAVIGVVYLRGKWGK